MPLYEYACADCRQEFELLVRGDEKPTCASCGGEKLSKLLSVAAAHSGTGAAADPSCGPPGGMCGMGGCGLPECGM